MPDKTDILKRVKACFKAANEVEAEQRQREREDIAFQLPENQWDDAAKQYRKGTSTSPGRPMLSVSLLAQPMALIQNQAVSAQLGVEFHPVSEKADPDVAQVMQGLYRRIERDSNAQMARLWALDRAKQAGRGWYRVNTQWDEDGDNEWDQEIVIERILHQDSVYIDPSASQPDFSDAQWAIVTSYVPVEQFERDYPGKQVPANDTEFKLWEGSDPEWVASNGERKAVLIAEYWWKEKAAGETIKRPTDGFKRQREKTVVKWALVTARDVLEEQEWMGSYIPLIPVIGTELQPIDGKRGWEGMVRKARDAQKYFNMAISTEVEGMAQESKAPWIGAEGFMEGHEEEWALSNVRNLPALEYKPTSFAGNLNPPPARAQVDTSKMMLAHQAAASARELVQMATNVYAPSLGELPKERTSQSGRAILALQQQADAGTSHFLQNLARVSMQYEARVVRDLLPKVYDRPGRVVQVLGDEDEPKFVMLNAPFVQNDKGRPQPIPAGMQPPPNTKVYDLTVGKYTVSTSVGKSFQTRLQQGAEEIGQLLGNLPPQLQVLVLPTYLKFRDMPGSKELYDLLKNFRDKTFPGVAQEEDGQPTVEQLKAQIEQMQQMGQMQQQQLQMAVEQIKTEQAKQQATIMKAQLDAATKQALAMADNDTKVRIAAADNETKLAIANLTKNMDAILSLLNLESEQRQVAAANEQAEQDRQLEAVQTGSGQALERERMDREDVRGQRQMAHESAMGDRQMAHESVMSARQQRHDMQMGAMQSQGDDE